MPQHMFQQVLRACAHVCEPGTDHQMMAYNLACYAFQLGKLQESLRLLERAINMQINVDLRPQVLENTDLEPLWWNWSESY